MEIVIRKAHLDDLDRLMELFECAHRFMQSVGNANQWINGYPQLELIREEIEKSHCYVCQDESGRVVATFSFIGEPDPNYSFIEGHWLNEAPYYVIHRLASDGTCKGIGQYCLDWCMKRASNIRIDTHADNFVMQRLVKRNGFVECGVIYVANGTPRIAYQWVDTEFIKKS